MLRFYACGNFYEGCYLCEKALFNRKRGACACVSA